jgi:hypothetical protein
MSALRRSGSRQRRRDLACPTAAQSQKIAFRRPYHLPRQPLTEPKFALVELADKGPLTPRQYCVHQILEMGEVAARLGVVLPQRTVAADPGRHRRTSASQLPIQYRSRCQ